MCIRIQNAVRTAASVLDCMYVASTDSALTRTFLPHTHDHRRRQCTHAEATVTLSSPGQIAVAAWRTIDADTSAFEETIVYARYHRLAGLTDQQVVPSTNAAEPLMRSFVRRLFLLPFCVGVLLLSVSPSARLCQGEEHGDIRSAIWQAFHARQEQASGARISFTCRSHFSKAYFQASAVGDGSRLAANHMDVPAKHWNVLLSGDRLRIDYWGLDLRDADHPSAVAMASAYDGQELQSFSDTSSHAPPHGLIRHATESNEWGALYMAGVTYSLRPLRPEAFGPSAQDYVVKAEHTLIDGHRGVEIEKAHAESPDDVTRILLDKDNHFVPIRIDWYADTVRRAHVEFEYDTKSPIPWFPTRWHGGIYDRQGQLLEGVDCSDAQMTFDDNIPASDFRLRFPPGTQVVDLRSGREVNWVVDADGALVPADGLTDRRLSRIIWVLTVNGILALVVLVFLILRARRRRALS